MLPSIQRQGVRSIWGDPFEALQNEFDRMLSRPGFNGGRRDLGEWTAGYPVDIREDQDHVFVDAELPGFKKDEINVTLESGVLNIEAERGARESEAQETAGMQHLAERTFRRVRRSFTVPTSVDESSVEATLSDGVLHLKLNKREEVKPRRIEVK